MMKVCKKGLHKYRSLYPEKRAGCLECRKLYMKSYIAKWTKNNPEKCYIKYKKWRLNNKKYNKKRLSKYQKENAYLFAFKSANRRKIVKERTPIWLTKSDWIEIKWAYKIAQEITKETGIKYEVDHIIPFARKIYKWTSLSSKIANN